MKNINSVSRRHFLRTASAGTAVALSGLNSRAAESKRPNVILIVGDDIGFSDIGCYGSEINTPNLDRLGKNGLRFSQFYNMAKCNPTRSSLLTGLYLPRENANNAQAFPQLMRDSGYYAATCGKEHFDKWVPKRCYSTECYDDSFVFSTCINFFIPPKKEFKYPFKLNGKAMKARSIPVKKEPFYKTDVITDYALDFIDKSREQNKPFYLYLPYHVAHYPLQARKEDIAKYRGKYKKGWDIIRQERFKRQKELGIIPPDCKLSPPEDSINKNRGAAGKYSPWENLSEKQKDALDLEMSVFAGMIDCMDRNIGRILNKLEEMGEFDNTLIMYFSDNGSCPYNANRGSTPPGGPDSYRALSQPWANVGNIPFRFYKQYGHEGGCRTQLIAHWPKTIKPGICRKPAHLVDIYPTMLDLAETEYPDRTKAGATPTLDGQSLLPLFKGKDRKDPEIIISGFQSKLRMVRSGDWKIVRVNGGPWQLYNMISDPTELNNLAGKMPEKVQELETAYNDWLGPYKSNVRGKLKRQRTN